MKARASDNLFAFLASQYLAVTFDDLRVRTGRSEGDFNLADLGTRFSTNVALKVPVVSAAMDRVTEFELAIALAAEGGLGILHRNLTPEIQASQVTTVKKHMNGKIQAPIVVMENATIKSVLQMCDERGFTFRSFPVINAEDKLVGMLTGNDIDRCDNENQKVKSLMTRNVVKGPVDMTADEAYKVIIENRIKVLPLVNGDGEVECLYILSDLKRIRDKTALHNTDAQGQLRVGAAVGTGDEAIERAALLVKSGVDVIVIDSAHGDSQQVMETFLRIKQAHAHVDVAVGNISEFDAATRLVQAGVDGIKVGQGGGSICTTRIVAGIGTPQVTAINNCARAVRSLDSDIPVCADGGIRHPGDITIALAAGANSVMLGMILAGTDESPGPIIQIRGAKYKDYRGMGSLSAMEESASSRNRYGQQNVKKSLILAEGVEGRVPYAGPLSEVLHQNLEGLRRGMGYAGVMSLAELHERADFIRVTSAGMGESHPHDILLEK